MGYTKTGLEKLGQILRSVRGDMTYREFEVFVKEKLLDAGVGGTIPHGTLRRFEIVDFRRDGPDYDSLIKLSYVLGYTVEELQAIASEREIEYSREITTFEDIKPLIDQLSPTELPRLGQYIFARLGRLIPPHNRTI